MSSNVLIEFELKQCPKGLLKVGLVWPGSKQSAGHGIAGSPELEGTRQDH